MNQPRRGAAGHGWYKLLALAAAGAVLCVAVAPGQQTPSGAATAPASPSVHRAGPVRQEKAAKPADPNADVLPKELARIHVQSSLVVAPVTVLDRRGQFVQSLSQDDFRVLDNGVPQRITEFSEEIQPVALAVVVQNNYSVQPLLSQVRPLGPEFSGLLVGSQGSAAVLEFSDRVNVLQPFTTNPTAIKLAFTKIHTSGSKARLNDALARAILMLSERPPTEKRVIVVFSEGYDHGSETKKDEIIQAAANADVTIYGLRFDPTEVLLRRQDAPRNPTAIYDADGLPGVPGQPQTPTSTQLANNPSYVSPLDLAAKSLTAARAARPKAKSLIEHYCMVTGGDNYSHWFEHGLQNQLQRVALEVNSQYVLAYNPTTLRQPGFHRLQVMVLEPNLRVRYRAGYFVAATTPAQTKAASKVKTTVKMKKKTVNQLKQD
jgi:VWFA-related protein